MLLKLNSKRVYFQYDSFKYLKSKKTFKSDLMGIISIAPKNQYKFMNFKTKESYPKYPQKLLNLQQNTKQFDALDPRKEGNNGTLIYLQLYHPLKKL